MTHCIPSRSSADLGIDTWLCHKLDPPMIINLDQLSGHFVLCMVNRRGLSLWVTISLCRVGLHVYDCQVIRILTSLPTGIAGTRPH